MEIIIGILFLILPIIIILSGTYIEDNTKIKGNNDFINHLAEDFHNSLDNRESFQKDNDISWQNGDNPEITFKIRHSSEFHAGTMHNLNRTWWIKIDGNIGGIAPGAILCYIW